MSVALVCPRDRLPLAAHGDALGCDEGHSYPAPDGIPVLLLAGESPTHAACARSLERAGDQPKYAGGDGVVDPFVAGAIERTGGRLYRHLVGRLPRYPIPELPLPDGGGGRLLDVGCNWGRWTVAAARRGYGAYGLDPSLEAIRAARRVAAELGAEAQYVVGDARRLPFPDGSFDVVFSYSVIQHFSKPDALATLAEIRRVLVPGGRSLVQMANAYGLRNLYLQLRRRRMFEPPELFDVRYWRPGQLMAEFGAAIGPSRLAVDGFFALNVQSSDLELMPRRYRALIRVSEALRRVPVLAPVADSVYVESVAR